MSEAIQGAFVKPGGTRFRVWAPKAKSVAVTLFEGAHLGALRTLQSAPLAPLGEGSHGAFLPGVSAGALYKFVLDGNEIPDPYARFLPFGVHGPAEVLPVAPAPPPFARKPLHQISIYELHVGTFTAEGTYAAAQTRMPDLAALGVTAIELLPLSAFPGNRGWGYDGVAHFAPQASYGRPEALRALIAAAHEAGLAVILDVVYNHFGPSGNYLGAYAAEYFGNHHNPWGEGPDYSQPNMRRFALDNARQWLGEYGFDGLRLDATHAIHDPTPRHLLADLHALATSYPEPRLLFAEDDRNEPALVREQGIDALWADDFHHQAEVLLTGERDGYYGSYEPTVEALAQAIARGWIFEGQVFPLWDRPRGKPAGGLEPEHFVYCLQNHDQIGNRALGTRLSMDAPLDGVEAATALLLFLPMTPLLFMGQEWAASTPFQFFTDHDAQQGPLVSKGRIAEFAKFTAFSSEEARAKIPDPQDPQTFEHSKLQWDERTRDPHRRVLALTTKLLALRRDDPVLSARCRREDLSARVENGLLVVERRAGNEKRTLVANFGETPKPVDARGSVLVATKPLESTQLAARATVIFAG